MNTEVKIGDSVFILENIKDRIDELNLEYHEKQIILDSIGEEVAVECIWYDEEFEFAGIKIEGTNECYVSVCNDIDIPLSCIVKK